MLEYNLQINHVAGEINKSKGVFFIGCGTAARVCHTAEYIFSNVADKHVNYIPASEFENYKHFGYRCKASKTIYQRNSYK